MSVASLHRDTAFQVRSLFRSLLRQSTQFSNYNFREYARRKTRDSFREHQKETEERRIQELIQDGLQNLRLMKRQTVISQFYQLDKLVVEGQKSGKETGKYGEIVRQKDTGSSRSGRHLEGPNRTRTGQIDHDIFEGLPVRRWSRQPYTFSQAPKAAEDTEIGVQGPGGTTTLPELPMPPDSHLLPAVSRALLRAARAGCIYVRQSGRSANDEDKEMADGEDQGAGAGHSADRSFTSRRWMTLSKNIEPPEPEFLAKRRPGLPSLYGGTAVDGGASGPMRRTKFQKVDPETGNISIYEAWVPEGHRIEGEISGDVKTIAEQSEVPVKPETPAPGTVVEGVGVVNSEGVVVAEAGSAAVMTPPKRRPPPPKRKGKGIGRGRKKKVMFAPGEGADAAAVHGTAPSTGGGADEAKEGPEGSQVSVDQSGQDEDEEDGEEGEESDEGDESMMDAKTPETPGGQSGAESTPQPPADTLAEAKDIDMADAISETQPSGVESKAPANQDSIPQPPADAKIETPQTDVEASVPPAPIAEKIEEEIPSNPTDTSEDLAAVPRAGEPNPLPAADNAVDFKDEEKPASEVADATTNEVKTEAPALGVDASLPAPTSASPEKPTQEPSTEALPKPSETEQPADASQQPQTEAAAGGTDIEKAQAPKTTADEEPSASKSKDDVGMSDAPEAPDQLPPQVQAEESTANPASPSSPTATNEAEPSASGANPTAPESAVPEPSNTYPDGTTPTQTTTAEGEAFDSRPTQTESAVEEVAEKSEEPEPALSPAPEST